MSAFYFGSNPTAIIVQKGMSQSLINFNLRITPKIISKYCLNAAAADTADQNVDSQILDKNLKRFIKRKESNGT